MFGQTIYGLKKWSYICKKFQTGNDSGRFRFETMNQEI